MRVDHSDVTAELRRREPIFHHPELGDTRQAFDAATVDDFWEIGASGRRYEREFIWSVLEERYRGHDDDPYEVHDFACRHLDGEAYLATYLLRQGDRLTRRATVWVWDTAGWRALYHQGTVVESE